MQSPVESTQSPKTELDWESLFEAFGFEYNLEDFKMNESEIKTLIENMTAVHYGLGQLIPQVQAYAANPPIIVNPGPSIGQTTPVMPQIEEPATQYTPSGFKFSHASEQKLSRLQPDLRKVVILALDYSTQDYIVYETARSLETQRQYVQRGVSQTMDSKHLPQPDGWSHAADLVPWIGGKPVWDWGGCYKIAGAMIRAANVLGLNRRIRWGGCWDLTLEEIEHKYGFSSQAAKEAAISYTNRRKAAGKSAFLDGPHFEWIS